MSTGCYLMYVFEEFLSCWRKNFVYTDKDEKFCEIPIQRSILSYLNSLLYCIAWYIFFIDKVPLANLFIMDLLFLSFLSSLRDRIIAFRLKELSWHLLSHVILQFDQPMITTIFFLPQYWGCCCSKKTAAFNVVCARR